MSRVNLESYDLEEVYILISRTGLLAGVSPPKKKARSDAITSDLDPCHISVETKLPQISRGIYISTRDFLTPSNVCPSFI